MDYLLSIQFLGLIFFSFVLIKATDIIIGALNRLSRSFKIGAFALTAFLLSLATTLPELMVSLASAFEGKPNLALGVAVGSNIANLSLVIGGVALMGGTIPVVGEFLKKDLFYTFLAGMIPIILLIDGRLSTFDGLILLAVYIAYNYTVLRQKPNIAQIEKEGVVRRILRQINHRQTEKQLGWLFVGIVAMLIAADMVAKLASQIAVTLSIPPLLIGLVLVAIGTSLPELSFGIRAVRKHKVAMVFGNLLGAVVANSTLILGLTTLVRPIQLDGGMTSFLVATLCFLVIFNLFWLFVRTKRKLERWEGLALIVIYFLFIFLEFWQLPGDFF